jgi:hypothetical protein
LREVAEAEGFEAVDPEKLVVPEQQTVTQPEAATGAEEARANDHQPSM